MRPDTKVFRRNHQRRDRNVGIAMDFKFRDTQGEIPPFLPQRPLHKAGGGRAWLFRPDIVQPLFPPMHGYFALRLPQVAPRHKTATVSRIIHSPAKPAKTTRAVREGPSRPSHPLARGGFSLRGSRMGITCFCRCAIFLLFFLPVVKPFRRNGVIYWKNIGIL